MENKELRERMLSGKMYNDLSVELVQRREQAVFLTNDYNSTYGKPKEVREALLRKLLRCIGSSVHFEPNFRCEFGFNISIGNNFLANFDCPVSVYIRPIMRSIRRNVLWAGAMPIRLSLKIMYG